MAEQFIVRGTILEKSEKSGESSKGDWTRYAFKIADHDTGRTRTYGWFSDKGASIKQGKSYEFLAEEKPNTDNPDKGGFLNIVESHGEIEAPAPGSPAAAAASANGGRDQSEFRRSKEELRLGDSLHMAATLLGPTMEGRPNAKNDIVEWAEWFNELLRSVDPEPDQVQESPPTDPPKAKTKAKATKSAEPASNAPFDDEEPTDDAPPAMSAEDLKTVLGEIGMNQERFEVEVLNTDWETFKARGGTPLVAYNRLKTWQEKHPGGVTV